MVMPVRYPDFTILCHMALPNRFFASDPFILIFNEIAEIHDFYVLVSFESQKVLVPGDDVVCFGLDCTSKYFIVRGIVHYRIDFLSRCDPYGYLLNER